MISELDDHYAHLGLTTMPFPRWFVTVVYRADAGPLDIDYAIEELAELQAIIERGPYWDTIDRIEIRLQRRLYDVTVEQAEDLL